MLLHAPVSFSKDSVKIPRAIFLILSLGRRTHLCFNNGFP
jgi:hypothetical protein